MSNDAIPSSAKLPPKSLTEDTQDGELPETNADDQRAPPVNMGKSREAGDGVTDADTRTGRADAKHHIPPLQTANRE
jgi:hypothetical protein